MEDRANTIKIRKGETRKDKYRRYRMMNKNHKSFTKRGLSK